MMHLEFDELLQLAEAATDMDGFTEHQIQQLEHLKTCRDCYESFCLLSVLSDCMSLENGFMFDRQIVPNRQAFVKNSTKNDDREKVVAELVETVEDHEYITLDDMKTFDSHNNLQYQEMDLNEKYIELDESKKEMPIEKDEKSLKSNLHGTSVEKNKRVIKDN